MRQGEAERERERDPHLEGVRAGERERESARARERVCSPKAHRPAKAPMLEWPLALPPSCPPLDHSRLEMRLFNMYGC